MMAVIVEMIDVLNDCLNYERLPYSLHCIAPVRVSRSVTQPPGRGRTGTTPPISAS